MVVASLLSLYSCHRSRLLWPILRARYLLFPMQQLQHLILIMNETRRAKNYFIIIIICNVHRKFESHVCERMFKISLFALRMHVELVANDPADAIQTLNSETLLCTSMNSNVHTYLLFNAHIISGNNFRNENSVLGDCVTFHRRNIRAKLATSIRVEEVWSTYALQVQLMCVVSHVAFESLSCENIRGRHTDVWIHWATEF